MRKGFKNIWDVDLVLCVRKNDMLMPLRNMWGEPAFALFKELYFLHLLYINSNQMEVPFYANFKRFAAEETGMSVRKLEYMMKKMIENGLINKDGLKYSATEKFMEMFSGMKMDTAALPWGKEKNYKTKTLK